jgi:UDP-N-acetylmuramate--alanine ligase
VHATDVQATESGSQFQVVIDGEARGVVTLPVPGRHNVANALATVAVAWELGVEFSEIQSGLAAYGGLSRRFERKGEACGVLVVDDYGHHPTEIRATLSAARSINRSRVVAVFQPHRYTRTRDLFDDFATCFGDADRLVVTGIYPAGEEPIPGVSGKKLVDTIAEHGFEQVTYVEKAQDLPEHLVPDLREGDLVLLLGAGTIGQVAEPLLEQLRGKESQG